MRTIIMAQGRQRRLAHLLTYPKQLLQVGDQTILGRTIGLIWDLPQTEQPEIHVIGWPEMMDSVFGIAQLHTLNEPGNCVLEGIAGVRLLFDTERTVILLGDVVYSRDAIRRIYADQRPVFCAGQSDLGAASGELFALSFTREYEAHVLRLLHTRLCFGQPHEGYQAGHLRDLYWAIQGGRLVRDGLQEWKEEWYLPIDDYTNDVDTVDDLATFDSLVRKAMHDDENFSAGC